MGKVKINQTVAGWIEMYKQKEYEGTPKGHKLTLYVVLQNVKAEQLAANNIDIVTLAKAIQYGYEVPYEFKVGDVVQPINSKNFYEVQENISTTGPRKDYINGCRNEYRLICKAENREDLK